MKPNGFTNVLASVLISVLASHRTVFMTCFFCGMLNPFLVLVKKSIISSMLVLLLRSFPKVFAPGMVEIVDFETSFFTKGSCEDLENKIWFQMVIIIGKKTERYFIEGVSNNTGLLVN